MVPGPPLDPEMAHAIERSLANGTMGGFGLSTDNCQNAYEQLSGQGIEFVQPPSKRPYGVEAVMRDDSGNWLVLVEPGEYTGEDFRTELDPAAGRMSPVRTRCLSHAKARTS